MKKNILVIAIVLMLALTCAYAVRKQASQPVTKDFTVVSVHLFTPSDKTKPVSFLGAYVHSYKKDGTFVHRQINSKGRNSYFYADADSTYRTAGGNTEKVSGRSQPTIAQVEADARGLTDMAGFKRVEKVHGLSASVIETYPGGRRYTQWTSLLYGELQMEREHSDGIEQIKVISVNDGYDPAEFAKIPPKQN